MKPRTGRKIKCWLCGGWQDERYTIETYFEDMPEKICLNCKLLIDAREDNLEQRIYEEELNQRDVTRQDVEEAEIINDREVDLDKVPAKETFLP